MWSPWHEPLPRVQNVNAPSGRPFFRIATAPFNEAVAGHDHRGIGGLRGLRGLGRGEVRGVAGQVGGRCSFIAGRLGRAAPAAPGASAAVDVWFAC